MSTVKPEEAQSFSPEAKIIRQLQKKEGNAPCYATPISSLCNRKDCGLRHDCFDEADILKRQSSAIFDNVADSRKSS